MAHAEAATPLTEISTPPAGFRPGTIRGRAGFFRSGQDEAGRWWLIDAEGRAFFCRAVHGVRAAAVPVDETVVGRAETAGPYAPGDDAAARLRRWGFNAVGVGGDGTGRDDGLAFMASVEFCRAGAAIQAPGMRLPDVFAPDWPQVAMAYAHEVCPPLAENRALIGWVTDDRPLWGAHDGTRPGLLQVCLSLEPSYAAYHAAWEFVLAFYGGKIDALARAWGATVTNKEMVRMWTRAEQALKTRGYLRDETRWEREFARRYFTTTAAAVRAADPNHLVLGGRFAGAVSEAVRAECVYPAVDIAFIEANDLIAAGAGQRTNLVGPVLAGDVCWAEAGFREAARAVRGAKRWTTLELMLRRGRALLDRAARHPSVTGLVWRQWLDDPGEQPPFACGLVHANGTEAREHTELLAAFNARAESLRRASNRASPSP